MFRLSSGDLLIGTRGRGGPGAGGVGTVARASPVLGVELLLNGGMDSDTVWSHGVAITISGGVMSWAGTAASASQPIVFEAGGVYRVTFTVTAYTAGGVRTQFLGGTTVFSTTRSALGTFQQDLVAQAGNNSFALQAITTPTLSVDNVSMIRVG